VSVKALAQLLIFGDKNESHNFDPKFFKVLCGEALFHVGEEVLD